MKAAVTFEANTRETHGKGASRALRRAGEVPAIIYGEGEKNVTVSLKSNILTREYQRGGFFSKIVEIKAGKDSIFALPKDMQTHPVSDAIEHMDFLRVNDKSTITVAVPVHFLNQDRCKGIKRGGVLNIVRHDLELVCGVSNIPSSIEIDLKDCEIGDSIHISAITLPEGVTSAITDRDFTIATVAGRGGKQDADDEAEDAAAAAAESAEGDSVEGGAEKAEKKDGE